MRPRVASLAAVLTAAALWTQLVPPVPAAAAKRPDPVIAMRLESGDGPTEATKLADAAKAASADGVALELEWADIEPDAPGPNGKHSYKWQGSRFDQTVSALTQAGVKILSVRLVGAPGWAVRGGSCGTKACPPTRAHYRDFTRFADATIRRYGPGGGTGAGILHWSLWNEPNKADEWGGRDASVRAYSNLLGRFDARAAAAARANHSRRVSVDAGELAAGGPQGSNGPTRWAIRFERFNRRQGRDGDFGLFTIHAYSQYASGVVAKVRAYQRLFAGHRVAVTEFGWPVGAPRHPDGPGSWKCAPSEAAQASRLRSTVRAARRASAPFVPWLVWFEGVDNDLSDDAHEKPPVCPTHSWYDGSVGPHMNAFGLYRRETDGSMAALYPRPARNVFRTAAEASGH